MTKEERIIILSSFLHDIGKFQQRALNSKQGTHQDYSEKLLKDILKNNNDFNEDEKEMISFLVKNHHEKDLDSLDFWNYKRVLAEIISEADNLSSGERLQDDDMSNLKPLENIFCRLDEKEEEKNKTDQNIKYFDMFPLDYKDKIWFTNRERYKAFFGEFEKDFILKHSLRNINFDSLFYLAKKYFWCIPSASYQSKPDVSLFDHSKTTAAIAISMYKYFKQNNRLENLKNRDEIKNREEERFSFICGDISGIQKFIYDVAVDGALKSLKGRSFYLTLLYDAVAKYILNELDLPITNILYSAGGKFYILSQKIEDDLLNQIEQNVNQFLFDNFGLDLYVGIGKLDLKGEDFKDDNMSTKWKDLSDKVSDKKKARYKLVILEQGHTFFTEIKEKDKDFKKELENLGSNIKNLKYIFEYTQNKNDKNIQNFKFGNFEIAYSFEENLEKYDIKTLKKVYEINFLDSETDNDKVNNQNQQKIKEKILNKNIGFGFWFMGGVYPELNGEKTLSEYAKESKGLQKIAYLRMDVDNLGSVFTKRLNHKTISRLTNISFLLDLFFSYYLNFILDEELRKSIFVVYSGGDDVFILGAWDKVVEASLKIQEKFIEFCDNKLTLSAGISIFDEKFTVFLASQITGEAEDKAKNIDNEKNAVCFLDKAMKWDRFVEYKKYAEDLVERIKNEEISRGILQKLMTIYELYQKQKKEKNEDILGQWHWRLAYFLERMKKEKNNEEIKQYIDKLWKDITENKSIRENLDVIVRYAEFLTKKGEQKDGV